MKSILQTPEWAEFKKTQGWEIINLGEIFVHKRSLPLGRNFLYLPEVSADDISPSQIEELKKITKDQKSIFTRLELIDQFNESSYKLIRSFGFDKAFEQIQPKWRQVINLQPSEDEILARMKEKGRYNVRLAERKGVKIENYNINNLFKIENLKSKILSTFYSFYTETIKREGIAGRSLKYFTDMVDSFKETDYLEIYIASYQTKPIAAAFISFYDGIASYLYGGSSREHKEVMAPYLMHWQIMKDAKTHSMKKYDMIGRDAPDKPGHWSGVTRFKEQFGGEAVEILGSFDFVNKPVVYKLFKVLERMRRK